MAGIAEAGALCPLPDAVDRGIPVVRQSIEMLHPDPRRGKGVTHRRDKPERRDHFFIPEAPSEIKSGFGCGTGSEMAAVAIPVFGGGVTAVTTDPFFMAAVGEARRQFLLPAELVAIQTSGPVLHVVLRLVCRAVAMEVRLLVAVHAEHSLLVMNIGPPPVFACILRVNSSAVAEGAGLSLVFPDKAVSLDEPDADAFHCRSLHMAVAAGSVAAPAGSFKYFFVEDLRLSGCKPRPYAVPLAGARVMEGLCVIPGDVIMAAAADIKIFGGPPDQTRMGSGLFRTRFIALVAGGAAFLEMRILPDQGTVDEKPPVIGLRLDRRRRTCSPSSLTGGKRRDLAKLF